MTSSANGFGVKVLDNEATDAYAAEMVEDRPQLVGCLVQPGGVTVEQAASSISLRRSR